MKTVKVGIIGTGGIANSHALGYLTNRDVCELTAVCDIDKEKVKAFAERHGVKKTYTDYGKMLKSDVVDAVSVCLPNNLHATATLDALAAGKHVLCEKPMATTVQEAEKMAQEAARTGLVLYIGFNHRFIASFFKGKEIAEKLGPPIALRIAYGHTLAESLAERWFSKKAVSGGGTLLDNGVHMIDMTRWYFGEVSEVSAQVGKYVLPKGDVEDNAIILLRLRNGAIASLQFSWSWWGATGLEFEALCTNGTLTIEGSRLSYYKREAQTWVIPDLPRMDGWKEETRHFVEAVAEGREPFVTPKDGLQALKIALAAYESCQTGKTIKLP